MRKMTIPASLLVLSIAGSFSMTSCGTKDNARVISKDSPWYNVATTDFVLPKPPSNDYYTYASDPYYVSNGCVVLVEHEKIGDTESTTYAVHYDDKGNELKTVNISDSLAKNFTDDFSDYEVESSPIFGSGDKYFAVFDVYKEDSYEKTRYFMVDLSTGINSECEDLEDLTSNGWISDYTMLDSGKVVCTYENFTASLSTEIMSLVFLENNESVQQLSVTDILGEENFRLLEMTSEGNKLYLYGGIQGESDEVCYIYDTNSGNVTQKTLATPTQNISVFEGKEYTVTTEGVFDISEKNETDLPLIDFNHCNIRRDLCSGMDVVKIDETGCTLIGTTYDNDDNHVVRKYRFEKTTENPNAGKKVLTVGIIGYVLRMHYISVYDFNCASTEYFIEMKEYFNRDEESAYYSINNGVYSTDEASTMDMSKRSQMIDRLSIDIMSGEGPDILFDAHSIIRFKNSDTLMDMTSLIEKKSKDYTLFDNVISASKTGDELYYIPLVFTVEGIVADKSIAGDKAGFTFDEYEDFVYGPCNGKDPVAKYSTRLQFFNSIFGTMSDLFYDKEGNINLQNDAFYELAKYCKENVPEEPDISGLLDGREPTGPDIADIHNIEHYDTLLFAGGKQAYSLYGLPSYDGRGPMISIKTSVSITASSSNKKGAEEYIDYLLTPEIQKTTAECYYCNPILKDTCIEKCKADIAEHNSYEYNSKMSESQIDSYIALLESARSTDDTDPAVTKIVSEEIQAYFKDQKSIEDVTDTMQNRVTTLINERK